jgi:hypothetical protein
MDFATVQLPIESKKTAKKKIALNVRFVAMAKLETFASR